MWMSFSMKWLPVRLFTRCNTSYLCPVCNALVSTPEKIRLVGMASFDAFHLVCRSFIFILLCFPSLQAIFFRCIFIIAICVLTAINLPLIRMHGSCFTKAVIYLCSFQFSLELLLLCPSRLASVFFSFWKCPNPWSSSEHSGLFSVPVCVCVTRAKHTQFTWHSNH